LYEYQTTLDFKVNPMMLAVFLLNSRLTGSY